MGFLTNIVSSVVKTALTPVAVLNDAVQVAVGNEAETTKKLLKSASEDVKDAFDDLGDAEML